MNIKYHDNMNPPATDPDGHLSNNWDCNADYGSEYVNVYYRVNTPAYNRGTNWPETDSERFDAETTAIFGKLDWFVAEARRSGSSATVQKDKSSLYLHPQEFSGVVLKNEVRIIAEALANAETFSLQWVDLYETVYDMSDEAYTAYLDSQEERIRAEVLKTAITTRRTKFIRDYDAACHVATIVRLRRVGEDDGRYGGAGKTANHIIGVIEKLIGEGWLVTATSKNGSRMIRTINKTEQKQRKQLVA